MRARLVVTPGGAGANAFDLAVTDYDSGAPVDASAAKLGFAIDSLAGVGKSTLNLAPDAAGRFSASGPNLSIDGIWTITATVTVPGGAVDVPLVIATKVADQPVEELVSPGLPTIYSVSLGALGTAQVYLDPGGEGQNELHATFFDAAGTELPIPTATMALTLADGSGGLATARQLEPGHFVATVDAPSPCHHRGHTMSHQPRSLVIALVALLVVACGGPVTTLTPASSPAGPTLEPRPSSFATVEIIEPAQGSTVIGATAHIVLKLNGAKIITETTTAIRPDEGHVHLYVNSQLVSMNYGLEQDIPVTPGTLVLRVEFVAADHAPFNPRVQSTEIVFTVKP
jgi:hypothetical protein